MTRGCCAFFSMFDDPEGQYLFPSIWENQQFSWTVMTPSYTEIPNDFLQILKADIVDITFPKNSSLLQYVDCLLCLPSEETSLEDKVQLFQELAKKKGHRVSQGKFCKRKVRHLDHLITDHGLWLDPDRTQSILIFPCPHTKWQLRGFVGLAGHHRKWIPIFPATAQLLYSSLRLIRSNLLFGQKRLIEDFILTKGSLHDLSLRSF